MNVYIIIFIIILLILCIYYFREPFNNINKRKYLIMTSAGDNTNFDKLWTNKNKNEEYDIWVVYYGDNDIIYEKYKNKVDRIWRRKGSKFQNFNYLYKDHYNHLMNYERFFIVDDDIIMSVDDINKLFDISKKYNLSICQPAFKPESKISHPITKVQPGNILRYTNFIEVNTPVFSKEALIKFMKYYDDILIGWGIDYLYIWANGVNEKNKYAIIDSITCINPYDDVKGGTRELNKIKNHDTRAQIWYEYSKKIGAMYDWPHINYNKIQSMI
jgi:hypothetical protein